MKISPIQQAILMYQAELSSQILIITFVNKVTVMAYNSEAFFPESKVPHPAVGTLYIAFQEKLFILKWIIERNVDDGSYYIDAVILNPKEAPAPILGMNGENISRLRPDSTRQIVIKFDSADATETAKGMVTWLLQEIGKIPKEKE